jgi:hypothetical protein
MATGSGAEIFLHGNWPVRHSGSNHSGIVAQRRGLLELKVLFLPAISAIVAEERTIEEERSGVDGGAGGRK